MRYIQHIQQHNLLIPSLPYRFLGYRYAQVAGFH
jgi:hypothetical protein